MITKTNVLTLSVGAAAATLIATGGVVFGGELVVFKTLTIASYFGLLSVGSFFIGLALPKEGSGGTVTSFRAGTVNNKRSARN